MDPQILASVAAGLVIWKAIKLGIDMALAKRNKGNPGHLTEISERLESIDDSLKLMVTDIAVIKDRTK